MSWAFVKGTYPPISLRELFGNDNPVEVEIGCGKGSFLVARAEENPGINFIGIDRIAKYMKRRKMRVEREEARNIQFIQAESRKFLEEALRPLSVSVFHMYFPDPWPKRRHRARRTFSEDFLKLIHSRLSPGGLFEVATDDLDYFTEMKKGIAATRELWDNVRETVNERIFGGTMKTNYEIKWAAEGRALYYAELAKGTKGS
ncbi:MAG TPA: tRNA (guanosine(46)-N7)-methyltransferase TrmB [Candidatus Omnitrophota bacterium]|nr:tRNA (guanosine(46)-N7)-methyltransferase TrmB [Candidatus Omnitrophota bacterium]